jgi:hypothetical protein
VYRSFPEDKIPYDPAGLSFSTGRHWDMMVHKKNYGKGRAKKSFQTGKFSGTKILTAENF